MEGDPFRSPLRSDANAGLVALVTGGGTGIGRATALELARTGARVAICGRRPAPIDGVRAEVEALGGECLAVPTDIREAVGVDALVDQVLARFGSIDILVNNAGGQFAAAAEDISPNGWRAVQRVTVDGTWNVTRAVAVRSMIPNRQGAIIFLGFSPRRGISGFAHACAARAALENLASSLSLEWSRYGIRSVCLSLGTILTDGLEATYDRAQIQQWERAIPLGRLGRPEEAAALIAFLASPAGAYITGTSIAMDGGADAWGAGTAPPAREARA